MNIDNVNIDKIISEQQNKVDKKGFIEIGKEKQISLIARETIEFDEQVNEELLTKFQKQILAKEKTDPFYNVNLLVFKDSYQGSLPLNGITESEFKTIKEFYSRFCENKTKFSFSQKNIEFKNQLIEAVKMLLTRRIGRQILLKIDQSPERSSIIIEPNEENSTQKQYEGCHVVKVNLKEKNYVFLNPKGERKIGQAPNFITLGHELLHVLHDNESRDDFPPTIKLNSVSKTEKQFHNLEEQVTITGLVSPLKFNSLLEKEKETLSFEKWIERLKKTSSPQGYEELNENHLLSAFGFPPRVDHLEVKKAWSKSQIQEDHHSKKFKKYLAQLISQNLLAEVKKVLEYSVSLDWNQHIDKNLNLLQLAVFYGSKEIAQFFLEKGADLHKINSQEPSLFQIGAHAEQTEMLEWLVEQNVKINLSEIFNIDILICKSITEGQINLLSWFKKQIQEQDIDIDMQRISERYKLPYVALLSGQVESLDWLINQKIDPHLYENRENLLKLAVQQGHQKFIKYFFKRNNSVTSDMDFSFLDEKGQNLCHLAVSHKQLKTLHWLVKHGNLNINQSDEKGQTPFHLAMESFSYEVYEKMIAWGADPSLKNHEGKTPRDIAFQYAVDNKNLSSFPKEMIKNYLSDIAKGSVSQKKRYVKALLNSIGIDDFDTFIKKYLS